MGTITIKNLSSLRDKNALSLVADFWLNKDDVNGIINALDVKIIKRGHTFVVMDIGKEQH